jgi:hypothetical protein
LSIKPTFSKCPWCLSASPVCAINVYNVTDERPSNVCEPPTWSRCCKTIASAGSPSQSRRLLSGCTEASCGCGMLLQHRLLHCTTPKSSNETFSKRKK